MIENTNKEIAIPRNLSEVQYFLLACFCDDLQSFYKQWIVQKRDREQFFFSVKDDGLLVHKYWDPSNICCVSKEILTNDNISIKTGYWTPNLWRPVKKDLLSAAKQIETLECQKIDCSCNDCKRFNREKGNNGICVKFKKPVIAYPNKCCPENLCCFEHRKE